MQVPGHYPRMQVLVGTAVGVGAAILCLGMMCPPWQGPQKAEGRHKGGRKGRKQPKKEMEKKMEKKQEQRGATLEEMGEVGDEDSYASSPIPPPPESRWRREPQHRLGAHGPAVPPRSGLAGARRRPRPHLLTEPT
eukprot:TRINITY_DN19560_c0_g1_i2.p2 TRINITY_DN19560_c0_g1~~TRINITY_DN19560_c0_g1_i2.p2  ORF type:complete len:160 (+),score=31.10 TRINITY_DN19560_c0_g1_i2:73-480(+)